jgi:ribosome-associated toxin RatA of RatAB toxin-antitoxin module
VLDVVSDVESYPEWAEGVQAAEVVERDGRGRPAQARFEVSSGLISGWYVLRYDWSEPDAVSWSLVESPLLKSMDGRYDLVEDDSGCEVTYTLSAVPSIPLIGPLRRKAEEQLVRTALQGLSGRVGSIAP